MLYIVSVCVFCMLFVRLSSFLFCLWGVRGIATSLIILFFSTASQYLAKKFLKKQQLRDYIRVIAKTKNGYFLRYFNFHGEEEEADEASRGRGCLEGE
jgi:hypothetical protein